MTEIMRRRLNKVNNIEDFFASIANGTLAGLTAYLENGGNVNQTNDTGSSLLHKAVADNNEDKVKLLIRHGCCINTQDDNGMLPLNIAIQQRNIPIIESLLTAQAMVNIVCNNHTTPLMQAVTEKDVEVIQLILNKGNKCDVNMENYFRQTALTQAILVDSVEICEILLKHGASMKCIYQKNFTTKISGLMCKNPAMMKVFLDFGTDINLHYHLMMACIRQQIDVAEMVLTRFEKPFQLKGLGFITKQENDNVWERLAMCVVKPYRYATKCSNNNELLGMLLNFCDSEHNQTQRSNHQLRAKVLIRKLVHYGLVICPQTSFKSCDPSCDCRGCIFTALYGQDPITSLKGQCCSVVRQHIQGTVDRINLQAVQHLNIPQILQDYICMNDWVL